MDYDSLTVADKLKMIRLGKNNGVPFVHDGEEFIGRQLDWLEDVQVNAEVKAALHVKEFDYRQNDQYLYRILAILNKAILVKSDQKDEIGWLLKVKEDDGILYLQGLYAAYMKAVYPKIEADDIKKEPTGEDDKK